LGDGAHGGCAHGGCSGRLQLQRLWRCGRLQLAVALWQIAAAVPCSCGGCGTCGCGTCGLVVLKGFGNKENKDTIHNTFKLAYDAAFIGGDVVAGAVQPNKSLLHFNMSGFSRMFALSGEDTE